MKSIWGTEEKETINLLNNIQIKGVWLNLAAGDGRYSNILLKNAKQVIALDIDETALKQLQNNTPKDLQNKLKIKVFDATKKLPFKDKYFDGVLCTGTLHLCSEKLLRKAFNEIKRILKPGGLLVFDFATDVKRALINGTPLKFTKSEPEYNSKQAKDLVIKLLIQNKLKPVNLIKATVPKEKLTFQGHAYIFSCNFFLVKAVKLTS